jgi:CheY-like chemotaxis protein
MSGHRFFLIDDNDIDIVVNTQLLKISGLSDRVVSFQTCLDAVKYFAENTEELALEPNVILMDIQMPQIGGFECLTNFQSLNQKLLKTFRIFMLSSSIDKTIIRKAEENFLVEKILEKPLDIYQLKTLLD